MGSLLLGSIGNTQIGVSVHAQAIIVAALNEQWDRLDGGQQRSIVKGLTPESRHVGGVSYAARGQCS